MPTQGTPPGLKGGPKESKNPFCTLFFLSFPGCQGHNGFVPSDSVCTGGKTGGRLGLQAGTLSSFWTRYSRLPSLPQRA